MNFRDNFWIRRILYWALNNRFIVCNPIYEYFLKKNIARVQKSAENTPPTVVIEVSNRCNASCEICTHKTMKRKQETMPNDKFEELIKGLVKMGIKRVNFTGFGETLTDPGVIEKIKCAKTNGMYVLTHTNGGLLTRDIATNLLNSKIDEIIFSIDSLDKDEYKKNRKLDLENTLENLDRLLFFKKAGDYKTKICINSVVYRKESWKDIRKIYGEYGRIVDNIAYQIAHDWVGGNTGLNQKNQEFVKNKLRTYPCPFLWNNMIIRVNGNVNPCFADYESENVLGNVFDESAKDIWNGNKLKLFRENNNSICKKCSVYPNWWMKI